MSYRTPGWTAISVVLVASLGAREAASHCPRTERKSIIAAGNGTLAHLIDSSPGLSHAARLFVKHFEEVLQFLKTERMRNKGAIRRREVERASFVKRLGRVLHLGWGGTRNCRSDLVGEFSHPNFTTPSIIFVVIRQYLEVVHVLAPR